MSKGRIFSKADASALLIELTGVLSQSNRLKKCPTKRKGSKNKYRLKRISRPIRNLFVADDIPNSKEVLSKVLSFNGYHRIFSHI